MTGSPLAASVIVALNPHSNDLAVVLGSFREQTLPAADFEVIVVEGGARPEAAAACADHGRAFPDSRLRLVATDRPGRAAANNAGARAARSELLVFVADDFIAAPTLVRAHVDFHRGLRTAAVGIGPALFPAPRRADPFCAWLEDSGRLFGIPFRAAMQHWPHDFFYVGNASIARDVFVRVGGFDEAFRHDAFDDYEFGVRLAAAGVPTHFLPRAIAWHDHELSIAERTEAVRRGGMAARHCVDRFGPSGPWVRVGIGTPATLEAAVASAEQALREQPSGLAASRHYTALMDLAYARGFHGVGVG